MSELWIDVGIMRSVATQFARIADQFENAKATLGSVIAAEGPSWGADEAGIIFASAYLPGSESVLAAMAMTADAMRNLTDALFRTTATFEGLDVQLADNLAGGL